MHQLKLKTVINAPAEVCFDLIRDIRVQPKVLSDTADNVVASRSTNGLGRTFTFESRYLGIKQLSKVLVIEYDRPNRVVDLMVEGYFHSFFHIHDFSDNDGRTVMTDTLEWVSPPGILGTLADYLFVGRYLQKLVSTRNDRLRALAESGL